MKRGNNKTQNKGVRNPVNSGVSNMFRPDMHQGKGKGNKRNVRGTNVAVNDLTYLPPNDDNRL